MLQALLSHAGIYDSKYPCNPGEAPCKGYMLLGGYAVSNEPINSTIATLRAHAKANVNSVIVIDDYPFMACEFRRKLADVRYLSCDVLVLYKDDVGLVFEISMLQCTLA